MNTDKNKDVKLNDKKAFKALFDTYFQTLCAFGNKYISDIFAVEDMIQEVFISLWDKRTDFDNTNAIKAFLYTSVRNKCLNNLKHQAVIQKHQQALIRELESEHFFTSHVIEEEVFNKLHAEIKKLPESAQEIMILALNGLKNQEIADELNISINTVKTQKKLAYSKLKDRLSPVLQGVLLSF